MKPELHKEEVLFTKLFEILHVLKNRDKIALLFSYIDSNNKLETYGSEMVKSKFEDLYKNSKSWPAAFKSDQRLLAAATNVAITDEASKAARTEHQQESLPAFLPAPLSSATIDELMDWISSEIKREFTKKNGKTDFKLLLKNPIYEPVWWPSELWDWSEVKKALKNQKYTGEGSKKDFMIATAKKCLDYYNLNAEEHVIPTYDHNSHVTKMKLKGQIVPPRAEFTSPAASFNGDSSSDSEHYSGRVLRSMTASPSSVSVTTIPTQLVTASGSQVTADMSTQSVPSVPSLQRETSLVSMASAQTSLSRQVPSVPSLVSVASSQASLQTSLVSVRSVPSLQNSLMSLASDQAGLSRQVSSVPSPLTNIVSVPSGQAGLKTSLASVPSVPSLQNSLVSVPSGQASLVSVASGQASLVSMPSGQAGLETSLASVPSVPSLLSVPSGQTSHESLPSIPSLQTSLVASGQAGLSGQVSTPCLQPPEADMRSVRSNISDPAFSQAQASHTPIPGHFSHQNSLHSHQQPHVTPGYNPVLYHCHNTASPSLGSAPDHCSGLVIAAEAVNNEAETDTAEEQERDGEYLSQW